MIFYGCKANLKWDFESSPHPYLTILRNMKNGKELICRLPAIFRSFRRGVEIKNLSNLKVACDSEEAMLKR